MLIVSFFFLSLSRACVCMCVLFSFSCTEIHGFGMGRWTVAVDFNDFWANKERAQSIGSRFIHWPGKNRMVSWHCMVHYRMRDWTRRNHKSHSQCKMPATIQSYDIHRLFDQSAVHHVRCNVVRVTDSFGLFITRKYWRHVCIA